MRFHVFGLASDLGFFRFCQSANLVLLFLLLHAFPSNFITISAQSARRETAFPVQEGRCWLSWSLSKTLSSLQYVLGQTFRIIQTYDHLYTLSIRTFSSSLLFVKFRCYFSLTLNLKGIFKSRSATCFLPQVRFSYAQDRFNVLKGWENNLYLHAAHWKTLIRYNRCQSAQLHSASPHFHSSTSYHLETLRSRFFHKLYKITHLLSQIGCTSSH